MYHIYVSLKAFLPWLVMDPPSESVHEVPWYPYTGLIVGVRLTRLFDF